MAADSPAIAREGGGIDQLMKDPQFSLVMPVYNGAAYLREALASLRWQTLTDWECICVNDGSSDDSRTILEEFAAADSRFRVLHQENGGIVAALNRGIGEARSAWIARMDADDVAFPERLAVQARFLADHPETSVLSAHMVCTDAAGLPVGLQAGPLGHSEIERRLLLGQNTINHPTVVMRREAVLAVGMYRSEFEWVEDVDLWLRIARTGTLATVPQVLLKYRLHEESVCATRSDQQADRMQKLLAAVRVERGLMAEGGEQSRRRLGKKRRTLASHKWARRAARSGYYRTAWHYWSRQVSQTLLSPEAFRAGFEVGVRVGGALLAGKWPSRFLLPDWRAWDVAGEVSASRSLREPLHEGFLAGPC